MILSLRNSLQILLLVCSLVTSAQEDVFTIAKVMPEFPGGTGELAKYLSSNVQYPPEARENNYSGKAYVNFIVDTSGNVLSPKIVKSSGHKCLDDEAVRVITAMPKWSSGSDSLRKVKVSMNMPVSFKNLGVLSAPPGEPQLTPEEQKKHEKAMKYYYEGHRYDQQQYYEKALEKFDLSLSIEPNNKYALFDKAKMHLNLGNKAKACEVWKNMVEQNIRKEESEEFIKKHCN